MAEETVLWKAAIFRSPAALCRTMIAAAVDVVDVS
jgi:hypothetical protein